MFDAVIFDLDGTLIDTESLAIRAGRAAFAALGATADDALFHSLIGKDHPTGDRILADAFPELDIARLNQLWQQGFITQSEAGLPLKPGVTELLGRLILPRALCTSSWRAGTERKLAQSGLAGAFAICITRDDVVAAKPHPEPYLLAADRLGVAPARCLVFEDSETGAEAAFAAGCTVVQVPDVLPASGRFAHYVAPSLIEGARLAGVI